MHRYPVLLLDYDGTLAETRPAILRSLQEAFVDIGHEPPSLAFLEERLGRGDALQGFYQSIVEGTSPEEAKRYVAAYRRRYTQADEEETFLYEGAHDVLHRLKERGYRMVALSNKHGPTLMHSIERFQLGSFFEAALGAEDDQPRKPQKEVFTRRVAPLFPDMPVGDFLMVGDTTADIHFARNVGMDVCWASYGHGTAETCKGLKPTYRFDDVRDLPDLLARTEQADGQ